MNKKKIIIYSIILFISLIIFLKNYFKKPRVEEIPVEDKNLIATYPPTEYLDKLEKLEIQ